MSSNVSSYIIGLGHYLPERVISNDFFAGKTLYKIGYTGEREKAIETSDEWIQQNMGIRERRYGNENDTNHKMAKDAIMMGLQHANIEANDLEGIVVATVTSERRFPSTACEVQRLLEIRPGGRRFAAYDIGAACAGYLFALIRADQAIRCGDVEKGIAAVGVEKLSSINDMEDANAPLFGDGAGASVIVPSSYSGIAGKLVGRITASYETSEVMDGN